MTALDNFTFFSNALGKDLPVYLLDEDDVIAGIRLHLLEEYLRKRIGTSERAGWYFQQFLKMSACRLPDMAPHYLVWDSDTIALRPLAFFNADGQVLVNPKTEHHIPYFEWTRKVLGIDKRARFSFISEHLMINKIYMRELIERIEGRCPDARSWVWTILDAIDDRHLNASGFSEYETYGNFMIDRYPDSYRCRPLKTMRSGSRRFGSSPSKYDLIRLMWRGYATVTCEVWDLKPKARILLNRLMSRIVYAAYSSTRRLTGRRSGRLEAADELCGSAASFDQVH